MVAMVCKSDATLLCRNWIKRCDVQWVWFNRRYWGPRYTWCFCNFVYCLEYDRTEKTTYFIIKGGYAREKYIE